MSEKQQRNINNSRLETMESSISIDPSDLSYYQLCIVKKAIELSHHLNPTADINTLSPVRYMFCLEYFFSIFNEKRRITNAERFMIFDKEKYVHSSVLINFLCQYKKDVGEIYQRKQITISAESIIVDMDKKVLLAIQKIWNHSHDNKIEAIPRENIQTLLEKIYEVFNIKKDDAEINKRIYHWKNDLSYFVIFEEFASLMRFINSIKQIKLIPKHKSCNGCSIF